MKKTYSLFESFESFGEFWVSGLETHPFAGVLKYSATKGVVLTFVCKKEVYPKNETLTFHGYTHETGNITLLNCYESGNYSSNSTTTQDSFFCSVAILGGHFSSSDLYKGCVFSLSNLNEFCHPQGFKLRDNFQRDSVLEAVNGNIKVTLSKTGKGNILGAKHLSSLLLLEEDDQPFKKELDEACEVLSKKHNVNSIVAKTDISYELKVEENGEESLSISCMIKEIYMISALFTVLMLKQAKPTFLSLLNEACGNKSTYPVLLSLYLNDNEIEKTKKDKNYHRLPVNILGINQSFSTMLSSWRKFYQDDLNLVSEVVFEHISGQPNAVHHSALLISALEQLKCKYSDAPRKSGKYDWPIDTYCNQEMRNKLDESIPLLRNNNESLGKLVSRLRGMIFHPNEHIKVKFKPNVKKVDYVGLANTSEILFIILVVAIYEMIGVDKSVVNEFKKNFSNHISTHHNIS